MDGNSTAIVTPKVQKLERCNCVPNNDRLAQNYQEWMDKPNDRRMATSESNLNLDTKDVLSWPVRMNVNVPHNVESDEAEKVKFLKDAPYKTEHYRYSFESLTDQDTRSSPNGCHKGYCLNGGKCIEKQGIPE